MPSTFETKRAELGPLNEKKLETIKHDPDFAGREITDNEVRGLLLKITKDGELTFRLRRRIEGTKTPIHVGVHHAKLFPLKEAREKALELWVSIRNNGGETQKTNPTLETLLDKYKAARLNGDAKGRSKGVLADDWDTQVTRFKTIYKRVLNVPLSKLTRDQLRTCRADYLRTLQGSRELNQRSLGPMARTINPAFRFAIDEGWLAPKVVKGFVPPKYDEGTRYLLPGEWQRIAPVLDAMPNEAGKFIRFLVLTGMRVDNALTLRFADIDTRSSTITTESGEKYEVRRFRPSSRAMKADIATIIPLVGDSLDIVKYFEQQRITAKEPKRETVFPTRIINQWENNPSRRQRAIEAAAGVAEFNRRDLRRTFATYMGFVGAPDWLVSMALSHTLPKQGAPTQKAADATPIYKRDDSPLKGLEKIATLNMADNSSRKELVLKILDMQRLLADIERGNETELVLDVQLRIAEGDIAAAMIDRCQVDKSHIHITARE